MHFRSRRDFLKQALGILGISLMPFPFRIFANAQLPSRGKRQHLINCIDIGGWDANWFFNYFDPNLNSRVSEIPWDTNYRTGSVPKSQLYNRYRYQSGTDVKFDGQSLAPGMKFWKEDDFKRICLWRGTASVTVHDFNSLIYKGGTSPYFASSSSLIAAYQAQSLGARPLHYVKLANAPSEIPTGPGMLTGVAVASCIPNQEQWKKLTTNASTSAAQSKSQVINDSIEQISQAVRSRLSQKSSKHLTQGYQDSFSASQILQKSNHATGDAFYGMWMRYFNAIHQEAIDHVANGLGSESFAGSNSHFSWIQSGYKAFTSLQKFDNVTAFKAFNPTGVLKTAYLIAWKFAMTAFLVINDLSAVVDFVTTGIIDDSTDCHKTGGADVTLRLMGLAAYRELTRHLAEVPNPEVKGETLLDVTLITYASEFSRSGYFSSGGGVGVTWGTNHANNWPLLFAGHLSNRGKIFGSAKIGDAASVPTELRYPTAPLDAADVPIPANNWFGSPVAQDPKTGAIVGGNAPMVSPYGVFPTIMKMFGCPIPPQQITAHQSIPFLMKS